jgi:hypothetical protein
VVDHLCGFRVFQRNAVLGLLRQRQHVGEMQGPAVRCLRDLLPAAEAVGDDERVLRGRAHSRQQAAFADGLRNPVVIALKAERAGHSATSAVDDFAVETEPFQDLQVRVHAGQRLLMTMPVHERLSLERR